MEHNAFQKLTEDEEEYITNFENPLIRDEEMLINAKLEDLNVPLAKQNKSLATRGFTTINNKPFKLKNHRQS